AEKRTEKRGRRLTENILAGAAGILIWLIPLIAITGWNALVTTARRQTAGHFLATGGTYKTEGEWLLRAGRLAGHLWTDGLGAWWPGRSPVTLLVAAGAVFFLLRGAASLRRTGMDAPLRLLALSCAAYAVWIFLFQNVVHQTR